MDGRDLCQFITSWVVEGDITFSTCVVYRRDGFEDEPTPLPQSCLYLNQLKTQSRCVDSVDANHIDSAPCIIDIISKAKLNVSAVDILCSAKRMEIYNEKGVYVRTESGIRLADLEEHPSDDNCQQELERRLFMLQYSFNEPVEKCQLKLVSLQEKGRICIHSLHVTLAEMDMKVINPLMGMGPHINVSKVKDMIKGVDIPDKAKGLMAAMETTQKNKEMMLGSFSTMLSHLNEGGKDRVTAHNNVNITSHVIGKRPTKNAGPPTMGDMMKIFASVNINSPSENAPKKPPEYLVDDHMSKDSEILMYSQLAQLIQAMEGRILSAVSVQIHNSEQRIIAKMEQLLAKHSAISNEKDYGEDTHFGIDLD